MRLSTQAKVDALHAEIKALLEAEKAYQQKHHPAANALWEQITNTRIDLYRFSPDERAQMTWASATLLEHP